MDFTILAFMDSTKGHLLNNFSTISRPTDCKKAKFVIFGIEKANLTTLTVHPPEENIYYVWVSQYKLKFLSINSALVNFQQGGPKSADSPNQPPGHTAAHTGRKIKYIN